MPLKVDFKIANKSYRVDLNHADDISIPLVFNGKQPNTYDVPSAAAKPYEDENFIGDTREGGGCNFEELKLIPHCNGTHTECVGHISYERISIHSVLKGSFIPATLITAEPVKAFESQDTYKPPKNKMDKLITQESLSRALQNTPNEFLAGLIIRTLPNPRSKMSRRYMSRPAPYFSIEAMKMVHGLGVDHLLVDIPSVDRAFDGGLLTTHHIFWDVKENSHKVDKRNHSMKTITEMIYVDDEIKDGPCLLNLQVTSFVSDASPSRPLIYAIESWK